jgi:hypothetical protein
VDDPEDFGNRCALLGELAVDRGVAALDALTHAQKLAVVPHAGGLQVGLPPAHVDDLFQLVAHGVVSSGSIQIPGERGTYVEE